MPRTPLPVLSLVVALLLALAATPGTGAPVPAASGLALPADADDDALEAALAELKRAGSKPELEVRAAALAAVVATGHEDALEPLMGRYARSRAAAAKAAAELEVNRILVQRRRVQLAELRLAAERRKDLDDTIAKRAQELADLERSIERAETKLGLEEPWSAALRDGARAVLDAQGDSKRRTLLKGLWKEVEKGDDGDARVAAAALLAEVAVPTTTTRLAKVMDEAYDEADGLQKGLPALEAAVNEWGRKMQDENEKLEGLVTKGTAAAYEQRRREASSLRGRITDARLLGDELRATSALALARQAPADRAEDVPDLFKLMDRSVHPGAFLRVLTDSRAPEAAVALGEALAGGEEPLRLASLVDHLAELEVAGVDAGVDLFAWCVDTGLDAPSWHLRSRSVAALATLRDARAIPVLVDRLEAEEGRLRSDVGAALVALTGQDFHGNVTLWRRWWADHAEGFVVPEAAPPSSEEKALAEVGLTFFGLSTESQRVLFVLDVSGSMERPMATYQTGGGAGDRRIDVARRELLKALGGIRDGGVFNIVCYASDVWTWADEPVVMEPEARAEATAFVEGIAPVGGTNVYGAMQTGLFQARGAKKKKGAPRWVEPAYDTIFLMSDGVPSMGVSTDRDGILTMVSEENADLGIVIHTIGLSNEQDAVLMRSLAEQNGGSYAAR